MTCLRCQGLLLREPRSGRWAWWWWWCVNCGAREGRTILRNQAEQDAERVQAQDREAQALKVWTAWFAGVLG